MNKMNSAAQVAKNVFTQCVNQAGKLGRDVNGRAPVGSGFKILSGIRLTDGGVRTAASASLCQQNSLLTPPAFSSQTVRHFTPAIMETVERLRLDSDEGIQDENYEKKADKVEGFNVIETDFMTYALCVNGEWKKSEMRPYGPMTIPTFSQDYAMSGFEGLKAFSLKGGGIGIWNLDACVARLKSSMAYVGIPPISTEQAKALITDAVVANKKFVPSFEAGNRDPKALYIRPFFTNLSPVLGVKPGSVQGLQVSVTPVGSYYGSAGVKPITLQLSDTPRALEAGQYKISANYAPTVAKRQEVMASGVSDLLYPTVKTAGHANPTLAECSSANIAIFKFDSGSNKTVMVVNENSEILPSTTKAALKQIAADLGYQVETREIDLETLRHADAAVAIGTAAVMSPIGAVKIDGAEDIVLDSEEGQRGFDAVMKLRHAYVDYQTGAVANEGFCTRIYAED